VLDVIRELKDIQGYSPNNIGIFGDSAGGGLALATVLKMRDGGMGMPAAVVVLSPWTDLTLSGDTVFSLINSDPLLFNIESIRNWAATYANPSDQKIPYVSPVYANFSKGFPPTLIQAGTREIVLSDSVRLYQALDQADIPVKLDVYEAIWYFSTNTKDATFSSFIRAFLCPVYLSTFYINCDPDTPFSSIMAVRVTVASL
jgi:acetyl esterase/lipase